MSFAQPVDLVAIAPPAVCALGAAGVLVLDLTVPRARRLLPALAVLTLLAALAALGAGARAAYPRQTFCGPDGCAYAVDAFTVFLQVLFAVAGIAVVLLCAGTVERERLPAGEFVFLLLTSIAGMLTLAGARDLLVMLLALEVVTLPSVVLVALRRADPRAAEAALKFFVISIAATALTVYGMSLLYAVTGSISLRGIAAALTTAADRPVAATAVVLTLAGFAFKVAAVPFHGWAPDTYTGAPVPIAAFLSVLSKAAGFAGLILLLAAGAPYVDSWRPVVAALAVATMTVGNLAALRQRNVVRLLAWSSIAQAGYILVPLAVPDPAAALAYLGAYAVMNLGIFGCAVAVARRRPGSSYADYQGLFADAPGLALACAFFLTCLAGLPPGVLGLVAKVVVFRSAVAGGMAWLAVVMAVNTVLALYYYARLAAALFDTSTSAAPVDTAVDLVSPRRPLGVPVEVAAAVGLCLVVAVVLGFWPQALLGVVPGMS